MENKIYIVFGISVRVRTLDDYKQDFAITQIKHDSWKDKSLEDYIAFEESWQNDLWKIWIEEQAYFLNFENAELFVKNNCCDMNDGGVYDFAAISFVYPGEYLGLTCRTDEEVWLYEYDNKKYKTMISNDEIYVQRIKNKVRGIVSFRQTGGG